MASDLPDSRWHDSTRMARALVTYMADERAVLRAVRAEFNHGPTLGTIRDLRADYLRSRRPVPSDTYKAHEGYSPHEMSDRAAAASKMFVARIRAERARSAAANQPYANSRWRLVG